MIWAPAGHSVRAPCNPTFTAASWMSWAIAHWSALMPIASELRETGDARWRSSPPTATSESCSSSAHAMTMFSARCTTSLRVPRAREIAFHAGRRRMLANTTQELTSRGYATGEAKALPPRRAAQRQRRCADEGRGPWQSSDSGWRARATVRPARSKVRVQQHLVLLPQSRVRDACMSCRCATPAVRVAARRLPAVGPVAPFRGLAISLGLRHDRGPTSRSKRRAAMTQQARQEPSPRGSRLSGKDVGQIGGPHVSDQQVQVCRFG